MRVKQTLLFFVFNTLLLTLFSGCGYLPSSHEAKKVMGESVSTKVIVSMEDPENTVLLKDALDEAVIRRFNITLRHKKNAKTHLIIELDSVGFAPLQYDSNGYIVSYRTNIDLQITRETQEMSKRYHAQGTFDFSISPNAIITDQQRFDAISNSATKALDSFVAQVAAEGTRQK